MREDIKPLFDIARERAEQREASSKPFELKQLFSRQEWQKFTNDVRRELGREFSYQASKGRINGVCYAGESQEHHNLYLKS